jgi:chlorobactene lauroyltransferase
MKAATFWLPQLRQAPGERQFSISLSVNWGFLMIKVQSSGWAKKVFHYYILRLLRRHFHSFRLMGSIAYPAPSLPILLLPNHSNWWDGFFFYLLNHRLFQRPIYLMMLERQLEKFRFFARVGAFSIAPEKPKAVLEALRYTIELLRQPLIPAPMICIFPQGEMLPWACRPMKFRRGVDWLTRELNAPLCILPLAIRIEYLGEQRPDVFFQFGETYPVTAANFPGIPFFEQKMESLLDELNLKIAAGHGSNIIWQGRTSVSSQFD